MSILSDNLKELRGSTPQSEFASELDMKQQQWARYEKGITVPGADILERICRIHSVSADWLLGLRKSDATKVNNYSVVRGEASFCRECPYKKSIKKIQKEVNLLTPDKI